MTTRNLQIKFIDPNNSNGQMKISYVNPNATDSAMLNFSRDLIGLTDNTYVSTYKNDETALD